MVLKQCLVLWGLNHLCGFISHQRLCNPLGSQQPNIANVTVACSVPSTCQSGSEILAHEGRMAESKNPVAEYIARKTTDRMPKEPRMGTSPVADALQYHARPDLGWRVPSYQGGLVCWLIGNALNCDMGDSYKLYTIPLSLDWNCEAAWRRGGRGAGIEQLRKPPMQSTSVGGMLAVALRREVLG